MTATDLPASLVPTLPGQYCTDPAIFSLEQTRVCEEMWSCAVRSADLPTPGSLRRVRRRLRRPVLRRTRCRVRYGGPGLHRRRQRGVREAPGRRGGPGRRYYAITVQPTAFVDLVPDHVVLHGMHPVSVDRTIVECDRLYTREVVEWGKDVSRSGELFHRFNERDFAACGRTQPAMSSRAHARGGVLVPCEHHIGPSTTG